MDNKNSFTFKKYLWNKDYLKKERLTIYFIFFILFLTFILPPLIKYHSYKGFINFSILLIIFKLGYKFIIKDHWKAISKNYHTWGRGAGAELNVKQKLAELGRNYRIVSDYQTGRGNIDFIVIGPKGIFTIEVKSDKGIISYKNETLLINENPTTKDYLKQTMAESFFLSDLLYKKFGRKYFVTGILEFPYGKIDTNYILGQIRNIWIGGYNFHKYVIDKTNNFLLDKDVENIASLLNTLKNKSK